MRTNFSGLETQRVQIDYLVLCPEYVQNCVDAKSRSTFAHFDMLGRGTRDRSVTDARRMDYLNVSTVLKYNLARLCQR